MATLTLTPPADPHSVRFLVFVNAPDPQNATESDPVSAQPIALTPGAVATVDVAVARAPAPQESALLEIELQGRALRRGERIEVRDQADGKLIASLTGFSAPRAGEAARYSVVVARETLERAAAAGRLRLALTLAGSAARPEAGSQPPSVGAAQLRLVPSNRP